ncbi:MAG: FHA domain-containing protein [Myxococcales bacterium]|nr:FHA domain-containing protein [Polyangiaceae bacterium]MDW8249112.1 FHA domain-containing protein [Myxococcales bacterium]
MATQASADLHAIRESAMRVAQALLAKGQKGDAIEILTAWASAANDQDGHKLLAEALRHGPDNPLAKAAFARMEGLQTDTSSLDAARAKWSPDVLSKLEKESKPTSGGWQAEVGYNNNVKYRGQIFHIQTEDSGIKRPHIITHLFADGGRILKSYKRSYAELIDREDLVTQVRSWMKGQHKEMYIALREGKFDGIIDGKEPGGMEILEGAPNPEVSKKKGEPTAKTEEPRGEAKKPEPPRVESKPAAKASPAEVVRLSNPALPADTARPAGPPSPPSASTPAMPAITTPPEVVQEPLRARLHVIRGFGNGPMLHELRGDEFIVGREGQVRILDDKFVAPHHARLVFRGPRLDIDPLANYPVFLRMKQPTEIEVGDTFVAGEQVIRVEANPPPNDGPDRYPTYFYSSPKWPTRFRLVQLWEGGVPGLTVVARTNCLQVGRSNSDLNFPNDFWLSDNHCVIEDQGGDHDSHFLMLTDLGSRGGTFVQIKVSTPLSTGDELLIGRTRLRVELLPF